MKYKDLVPVKVKKHRDKNGAHNHVILGDIDNNHISVGLSTKSKKGKKGGNNFPLKKDTLDVGQKGYKPQNPTYMRRQATVDNQNNYYRSLKGSMVKEDYQQAMVYGNRAKAKYLSNKKNNGSAKRVNESPSAMGQKLPDRCSKLEYAKRKNLSSTKTKSNVKGEKRGGKK